MIHVLYVARELSKEGRERDGRREGKREGWDGWMGGREITYCGLCACVFSTCSSSVIHKHKHTNSYTQNTDHTPNI